MATAPTASISAAAFMTAVPSGARGLLGVLSSSSKSSGRPEQDDRDGGYRSTHSQQPRHRPPGARWRPAGGKQQATQYQQGNVGIPQGCGQPGGRTTCRRRQPRGKRIDSSAGGDAFDYA